MVPLTDEPKGWVRMEFAIKNPKTAELVVEAVKGIG
jgi:hypothetical protein